MADKKSKSVNEGNIAKSTGAVKDTAQQPAAGKGSGGITTRMHQLIATGIAIITWLVLKVCLDNQFTDWDDAGYIVNNPIVRDISPAGLKAIFSEPVMGNYHPLTILGYAIEYSLVELEPWLYHADSLLFHLLVTMSVYWLVNLLTKSPVAAVVAALMFGIHPMHTESVAWVAGRKDVLCALFYVNACSAYLYYLRTGKKQWYVGVIVLFIGALLSKPVAVTLPVVMLLIDYFEQREWKLALLIEKVPHFIIALIAGVVSVKIQSGGGAMAVHKVTYTFFERVALGSYAFITYLWKAVAPVHLCVFYPYPQKVNGVLPAVYYVYPLAVVVLALLVWVFARRLRVVVFGVLFFVINIALLLQFIPVGEAIVAERYSYIPYLGLFVIVGWLVSLSYRQGVSSNVRNIVTGAMVVYLGTLAYASNARCSVWYDATTLWSDEIAKEPDVPISYNNMGYIYFNKKAAATNPADKQMASDSAIYMMKKAIALKPDLVNAYQGLGMLYYMKGDFETSTAYFRSAVRVKPSAETHSDLGNLLLQAGKTDSALMEYDHAVRLDPKAFIARLNRGRMLKDMNRLDDALTDLNMAIEINPAQAEPYYLRSICYAGKGNRALALQDVEKAISLGYKQVDNNYYQGLKN